MKKYTTKTLEQIIRMPKEEQQKFKFKNNQKSLFAPIVGFFELESIIEPFIGSSDNTQSWNTTRALEEHKPCSYALLFVALNETKQFFFDLKCWPNVMIEFAKSREQIAKNIYEVKQQYKNFSGEQSITKGAATLCWICENELKSTRSHSARFL